MRLRIAIGVMLASAAALGQQTVTPAGTTAHNAQAVQGVTGGVALHTVCDSGCGGASSFLDLAAFTASVTAINVSGGVFDDTLAAVVAGKAAAPRMTSKRALHFNLRDNSGNEIPFPAALDADLGFKVHLQNASVAVTGTFWQVTQPVSGTVAATQSGTWTVQPGNTANTTAWLVTGTGGTFPVTGTVTTAPPSNASTNVAQLAGTTTDTNSGTKSAGTLRVVLATDQPALTNKLLVTPDSVALPANQSVNLSQVAATTTDTNSGLKSAGTLRVVLATDQPALTNKLLVTPDSVALPANQSVNVTQWSGTASVTGSGTATGALRVELANNGTGLVGLNAGSAIVGKVGIDQTTPGTTNAVQDAATSATGSAVSAKAAFFGGGAAAGAGNLTGATVKAASTASAATDTAVVVAVRDAFALTANQSVNVAQVGGTNTLTGGSNGSLGVGGLAADGSAVVGNPVLSAGKGFNGIAFSPRYCDKIIAVTTLSTTATVQQIALAANQKIYICGYLIKASTATTAVTLKWVEGTGANCVTGTADVTPTIFTTPTAAPTTANFTLGPFGSPGIPWMATAGDALCITQSSTANATTLSGVIYYTQTP